MFYQIEQKWIIGQKKKKKNWTNHEDVKVKNQTNTQQFQVSFNSCLVKILSQLGIMPY